MTPLNKIPGAATGHHQDETQISQTQALWFFFVSHSHGWSELKPRSSRNPDPFKQKIKVDQTHSSRSRRRRRGPTGSEWEKKRLIRPIEAKMNEEWLEFRRVLFRSTPTSVYLFNKILILLPFLLFSHSWPFSLSLSDPTIVIIT